MLHLVTWSMLVIQGKQMNDSSTLGDYNVADKSTLQLLLRFKGSDFFFYYTDPRYLDARFDYDFSNILVARESHRDNRQLSFSTIRKPSTAAGSSTIARLVQSATRFA